jgi:hypothetical protein
MTRSIVFVPLHNPLDVRIKLPSLEPRTFINLVKTKKKGILKIPAVVGGI